jgi:hypothetical protein
MPEAAPVVFERVDAALAEPALAASNAVEAAATGCEPFSGTRPGNSDPVRVPSWERSFVVDGTRCSTPILNAAETGTAVDRFKLEPSTPDRSAGYADAEDAVSAEDCASVADSTCGDVAGNSRALPAAPLAAES